MCVSVVCVWCVCVCGECVYLYISSNGTQTTERDLLFTSWEMLGKLQNSFMPQFLYMLNGLVSWPHMLVKIK